MHKLLLQLHPSLDTILESVGRQYNIMADHYIGILVDQYIGIMVDQYIGIMVDQYISIMVDITLG